MEFNFHNTIQRFGQMGEKTNWYYLPMPDEIMQEIFKIKKHPIRVKGFLDNVAIEKLALWTAGKGEYILPINLKIRKLLKKDIGQSIHLQIQIDNSIIEINEELLECLQQEPLALERFNSISKSFQNNFSRMVNDAKTPATKAKRIAKIIRAFLYSDTLDKIMEYWRRKD